MMITNLALPEPACDIEGCSNLGFPECQYVAVGLDLKRAIELSESWRRGEYLPAVGHDGADRLSQKLNQMTSQPTPLAK